MSEQNNKNREELESSATSADQPEYSDSKSNGSIPFWRVMLSVIQAAFGVQNKKNKERDFSQGKLMPFIVAALIFTLVFVVGLILIVKLVLSTA